MSIKFSVIVPIYKVQDYLEECIESIIHQTYENLEIILVDDGSPDECPAICDRYAAHDSRIKVIHKANGGQSDARNAGIEIAKGDYIAFVDSDDWIAPDTYELLAKTIEYSAAQVVCFGRFDVYRGKARNATCPQNARLVPGEQAFLLLLEGNECAGYIWHWVFSYDLFQNIRFPIGELYEDIAIIPEILLRTERVMLLDERLYYYRHRKGSALNCDFSERNMLLLNRAKMCIELAKDRGDSFKKAADRNYANSLIGIMSMINRSSPNVRRMYCAKYRWCKSEIRKYESLIVGDKNRIKYYLLMCGLYRYVLPLYHRAEK